MVDFIIFIKTGGSMKNLSNETSNALFNAYDIKKTIESNGLGDIKRVHGGTDNDDTLNDLIHDLVYFLERLDKSVEEISDE
tara:strand:- start:258 stop:500 length:243 start_codon:yes stop_codon:yes gene_type:complete